MEVTEQVKLIHWPIDLLSNAVIQVLTVQR